MNNPLDKNQTVIKVAIADDHALFRTGVKTSLSSRKRIQMVAEAENGLQLLNILRHIQPDIVLLDIQMPIMDGLSTLPEIKRLYPEVKVIMLTMHNDPDVINKMMEIGASSYLTKESGSEMIYETIEGVFNNGFHFNELTNSSLLSSIRKKKRLDDGFVDVTLTEKEATILKLICEEKSPKEIAEIVDLSPRTVEAIRDKLKTKTGTKSIAELVMFALSNGISEDRLMMEKVSLLSLEQIKVLFHLSTSILSYINHDLSGQRSIVSNSLNEINSLINKEFNYNNLDVLKELVNRALEATKSISSINKIIKSSLNKVENSVSLDEFFVAWPSRIISEIRKRNKNIKINTGKSLSSLRLIYPHTILYSILSELVENARKYNKEDIEVFILWKIDDNKFKCEVHDGGVGFPNLKARKFVPIGSVYTNDDNKLPGMGLRIIERTIMDSGGHVFCANSDLLNGAMIHLEFPVLNFCHNNV